MINDDGHELRRLPILRGLRARYKVWRAKRAGRLPPGTVGRGAKDGDREQLRRDGSQDRE